MNWRRKLALWIDLSLRDGLPEFWGPACGRHGGNCQCTSVDECFGLRPHHQTLGEFSHDEIARKQGSHR